MLTHCHDFSSYTLNPSSPSFSDTVYEFMKEAHLVTPSQPWTLTKCPFSGLTNQLFLFTCSLRTYIVRMDGEATERFIDRVQERERFLFLSQHQLAPSLFMTFKNGMVYEYIEGEACTSDDLPNVAEQVARTLKKWHEVPPPSTLRSPTFLSTLWKWLELLKPFSLSQKLEMAITDLEARLPPSRMVCAHNDLLAGNIVKLKNGGVQFIDYEYGGVGYAAFDIANHFCEWAGFDCDWRKLPTPTQQRDFLRIYLDSNDVEAMYLEIQPYFLASHLFWCLWGFLQHDTQASSNEKSFDYFQYAELRWKGYEVWEQQLKSLDSMNSIAAE
ncbi:Ethanolamine kinase [Coelomomyces lativittatus]|nr:Ethanolamine kinase [Coelomomyces lativittatus]KAJ1511364.1 Ethanolamine kinase [Coelomomyces lativittatus]KAJ1516866.1 Ethanolamine kinase [Coelomomyces lativittatus]